MVAVLTGDAWAALESMPELVAQKMSSQYGIEALLTYLETAVGSEPIPEADRLLKD